jgi:hypothetical protein
MRRNLLGVLQRATVLKVSRNPRRAKSMATGGVATVSHVKPYRWHLQ